MSGTDQSKTLIQVESLVVEFELPAGTLRAVDDASFLIVEGRALGIVGESGSGKSVLCRALLGMVHHPGVVRSGAVVYEGQNVLTMSDRMLREIRGRRIAMIFQDPRAALNPNLSVGAQIADALRYDGVVTNLRDTVRRLLSDVGIHETERVASAYPRQLSGGMCQRATIALALTRNPRVLIADEATTDLDVVTQRRILELLARLESEHGMTLVVVTHDIGIVQEYCADAVVMYAGRVMEHGVAGDIVASPKHPYTAGLIDSIPPLDTTLERQPAIPGLPPDPFARPVGCPFAPRCRYATPKCEESRPAIQNLTGGRSVSCVLFEAETER